MYYTTKLEIEVLNLTYVFLIKQIEDIKYSFHILLLYKITIGSRYVKLVQVFVISSFTPQSAYST